MADPALHVIAGPNGAGKTTFFARVVEPVTHLEFVNADLIAAEHWPGSEVDHAYDAAALAATQRASLLSDRRSFATEAVFSHESMVALLRDAKEAGYRVTLHAILIPEELAVARVLDRVANGGHAVPEQKVRERCRRLWTHVSAAIDIVDEARVYDNSTAAAPFRLLATYVDGHRTGTPKWPAWSPTELLEAGRR